MATVKLAQIFDTTVSAIGQQFHLTTNNDTFNDLVLDGSLSNVNVSLSETNFDRVMQPEPVPLAGSFSGTPSNVSAKIQQFLIQDQTQFTSLLNNVGPDSSTHFAPTKASAFIRVSGLAQSSFAIADHMCIDPANFASHTGGTSNSYYIVNDTGVRGHSVQIKTKTGITATSNDIGTIDFPMTFGTDSKYTLWIHTKSGTPLPLAGLSFEAFQSSDFQVFGSVDFAGFVSSHLSLMGLVVFLDDAPLAVISSVSSNWEWLSCSFVVPDRKVHKISIFAAEQDRQFDMLYVTNTSETPNASGLSFDDSPYVTIHSQLYSLDVSNVPTTPLNAYDFITTLQGAITDDWQSFDVSIKDGSVSFSGLYAFVLMAVGGNPGHFISWDVAANTTSYPSSAFDGSVWSNDSQHNYALRLYSDRTYSHSCDLTVDPAEQYNLLISDFDSTRCSFVNTALAVGADGHQYGRVVLDFPKKTITFVLDQSGSMTWRDHSNVRSTLISRIANRLQSTYPYANSNLAFNLITLGGSPFNVSLFTTTRSLATSDPVAASQGFFMGTDYTGLVSGIRLVRKMGSSPTSPIDGEILKDGIFSGYEDTGLQAGQTYFYKVFTYDKHYRFSPGVVFSASPKQATLPFGVANFTNSIINGTGLPLDIDIGACYHFYEGSGSVIHDFAYRSANSSRLDLTCSTTTGTGHSQISWLAQTEVPVGYSGIRFNGTTDVLLSPAIGQVTNDLTIMAWIYRFHPNAAVTSAGQSVVVARSLQTGIDWHYALALDTAGHLIFQANNTNSSTATTEAIPVNQWTHVAVTYSHGSGTGQFYINGVAAASSISFGGATSVGVGTSVLSLGNFSPATIRSVGSKPFFGMLTELSVHSTVRSSSYISGAYNTQLTHPLADSGDRLLKFTWNVPVQSTGLVQIVERFAVTPTSPSDGTLVYSHVLAAGSSEFYRSASFIHDATYNYRIFTQNSVGDYTLAADSPVSSVYIPPLTTVLPSLSPVLSPLSNFTVTSGRNKNILTWAFPSDSRVVGIKIYASILDTPAVTDQGVVDTKHAVLKFTTDTSSTLFVDSIVNGTTMYYTAVTITAMGQVSAVSTGVGTPSSTSDDSSSFLPDVSGLYSEPVNATTIVVGWRNPTSFINDFSGYLDDVVFIYGMVADNFGNPLTNMPDIRLVTKPLLSSQNTPNIFSPGAAFNGNLSYNVTSSYQNSGLITGTLQFDPHFQDTSTVDSMIYTVAVQVLIRPATDTTDAVYWTSSPVTITLSNPLDLTLTNVNHDTILVPHRNNDNTVTDLVVNGCYAGRSAPIFIQATTTWKGQPNYLANVSALVFDSSTPLGDVLSTTTPSSLIVLSSSSYSATTGSTIMQIVVPASPISGTLFTQVSKNGFVYNRSFPLTFTSPLRVQVSPSVPRADGIDVEEQFCRAWMVNPNDPTIVSPIPDFTAVKWELADNGYKTPGLAAQQPFYSTDNVPLDNGVYSFLEGGTARRVFLGPLNIPATGGSFLITAKVVYNGLIGSDFAYATIYPLTVSSSGFAGTIILAEFPSFINKMWCDGEDYIKLSIFRDPQSSAAAASVFGSCFVTCSTEIGNDLSVVLPPGLPLTISTTDDYQIVWGDVVETTDSSPDGTSYNVLDTSHATISKGVTAVTISADDVTKVYFRLNRSNITKTNSGQDFVDAPPRHIPPQCQSDCFTIHNGENFTDDYSSEVTVLGATLVGTQQRQLAAGGSNGIPPLVITPRQPLDIKIADIRTSFTGGEDHGHIADTYVPTDVIVVDGTSYNEIVFEVSWRGKAVPDNTPVLLSVLGAGIFLPTDTIYTLMENPSSPDLLLNPEGAIRSYARLYLPPLPSNIDINAAITATCAYDKLGLVTRNEQCVVSISYSCNNIVEQSESDVFSGSVFKYSIGTGLWSQVAGPSTTMPHPRAACIVQYVNSKFYVIGGMNGRVLNNACDEFDPVGLSWIEKADLPTPRAYACSVVANDISAGGSPSRIFVIGGFVSQSGQIIPTTSVEAFDPVSNTWIEKASLPNDSDGNPYTLAMASAVAIGGKIYVLSGIRYVTTDGLPSVMNDRVLIYDITNDSWSIASAFSDNQLAYYQRLGAFCWSHGTKIYVVGGLNSFEQYMGTAYSFDTSGSVFARDDDDYSSVPISRYRGGAVTIGNTAYFIGGTAFDFPYKIVTDSVTWSNRPDVSGDVSFSYNRLNSAPLGLHSQGIATDGSSIYVFGGISSGRGADFIQLKLSATPMSLDGRNSMAVIVKAIDRNGQPPPSFSLLVDAHSYELDVGLTSVKPSDLPTLPQLPVCMTDRIFSVTNGYGSTVVYPRSADPSPGTHAFLFSGIVRDPYYSARTGPLQSQYQYVSLQLFGRTLSIFGSTARSSNDKGVFISSSQNSKSPFLLAPSLMPQGSDLLLVSQGTTPTIPVVKTILGKNSSSALDVVNALYNLSGRIAFGGTPLFDALDSSLLVSLLDNGASQKLFYVFTDGQDNQSALSSASIVDAMAATGGLYPQPVICVDLETGQNLVSEASERNHTVSPILSQISSITGGQSFTVVSSASSDLDSTVGDLVGRIEGSVGFGTFEYDINLREKLQLTALALIFTLPLPVNTSASWKFALSDDGLVYSKWSLVYSYAEAVRFNDLAAAHIKIRVMMDTGMSTSDSGGSDHTPTSSPSLEAISVIFNRESVAYIYVQPTSIDGHVNEAVLSVSATVPPHATLEVGVATADHSNWNRFQTPQRLAVMQNGKMFMPFRNFTASNTYSSGEPLDRIDQFLFKSRYGAWEPTATVSIFSVTDSGVYDLVSADKYHVYPDAGIVCFKNSRFGSYVITITNPSMLKLGLKVTSRSPYEFVKVRAAGVSYAQE